MQLSCLTIPQIELSAHLQEWLFPHPGKDLTAATNSASHNNDSIDHVHESIQLTEGS